METSVSQHYPGLLYCSWPTAYGSGIQSQDGAAYTFQALRSKKCKDIYLFREISGAHLLPHERCRAAGNEWRLSISLPDVGGIYAVQSKMKHLVTALVSHFHPLLTFLLKRPEDFQIDFQGKSIGA